MNKQSAAVLTALWLVPAASVWAHPGHGDESSLLGLLHLLEPVHLLPVLAVVAVAALLRRRRRPPARGDRDESPSAGTAPHARQD